MKRVLCYGDSNTWGYVAGSDHERYGENQRWTKLLQKKLGGDFEIIEEGLCSRTLCSEDRRPGKEGRNGYTYLKPCLEAYGKVDVIILMLGTNELKNRFGNSAEDIVEMLDKNVQFIRNFPFDTDNSAPTLIISGLPPVNDAVCLEEDDEYKGTGGKSRELNVLYEKYCKAHGLIYVNNDDLATGSDGVHLTAESHSVLSGKLSEVLTETIPL